MHLGHSSESMSQLSMVGVGETGWYVAPSHLLLLDDVLHLGRHRLRLLHTPHRTSVTKSAVMLMLPQK